MESGSHIIPCANRRVCRSEAKLHLGPLAKKPGNEKCKVQSAKCKVESDSHIIPCANRRVCRSESETAPKSVGEEGRKCKVKSAKCKV